MLQRYSSEYNWYITHIHVHPTMDEAFRDSPKSQGSIDTVERAANLGTLGRSTLEQAHPQLWMAPVVRTLVCICRLHRETRRKKRKKREKEKKKKEMISVIIKSGKCTSSSLVHMRKRGSFSRHSISQSLFCLTSPLDHPVSPSIMDFCFIEI